jgi:O-antigen/teichoic acid export membrane protein
MPNWFLTVTERAPGTLLPIMVTELLSPAANAVWYAAWMIAWVVYIVPIQVGLNLFAEAAHSPKELQRATRQGILTSLAIGVLAALGAGIVGPFLLLFLGGDYADSGSTPLRILVLAFVPFTFIQAYFAICRSRGTMREAIIMGWVAGASGVGAATLMSGPYGLTGMAIAWVATQSLVALWAYVRLRALLDEPGGAFTSA